jgi:hypothetical protein
MAELFRHATPIDFGIGYRWRHNESNLLLAQKNAPQTSDQELTPASPSDQNPAADESQAPKKAKKASGSHRRRAETYATGALGCRYGGVFPFCSEGPPRTSR